MWKKTFVSAFIAQVLSMIGFAFALPFLPFFIAELGIHDQGQQAFWSGIVLGASGITFCIFAPIWGIIADRYGRKIMVCRSMFGGTVILLLMSMVQTVEQLVICRLLQGALTGTIAASLAMVASVTPQKRSGLTLGMMQAAVYIGVTIGPLFGGIIADLYGYRAAFRAGALVVFLGGLLVLLMVKENFVPPDDNKKNTTPGFRRIIAVSGFMMPVIVKLGVHFNNSMVNPSFPLIVKEILPSAANINSITGSVVGAAALAGAFSSGILGYMGDKLGHKRILVTCCIAAAVASAGHFFVFSLKPLFAVRILFGLSIAGMLPAANAMINNVIDSQHVGKAYGAATSISMLGLALGPFIGGSIAKATDIRTPFLVVAMAQIMLAILVAKTVQTQIVTGYSKPA